MDPATEPPPRPIVAIDGELVLRKTPTLSLPTRYGEAVHRAGGLPLALTPFAAHDEAWVDEVLDRVDGLLLSGGDDFDMEALGLGPTHPEAKPIPAQKQAFGLNLVRRALAREVPILGVCHGMQLMALAEGAGLHQHLPDDRPGALPHAGGARHDVTVAPGSKLAGLLGVARVSVISRHHQALSTVGPEWTVTARDDEDLIEGVERRGHPFAVGVQWHPEQEEAGTRHDGLFAGLVRAASDRAAMRAAGAPREAQEALR